MDCPHYPRLLILSEMVHRVGQLALAEQRRNVPALPGSNGNGWLKTGTAES